MCDSVTRALLDNNYRADDGNDEDQIGKKTSGNHQGVWWCVWLYHVSWLTMTSMAMMALINVK